MTGRTWQERDGQSVCVGLAYENLLARIRRDPMPTPRDLIRMLYDAFARGDAETVLGALHEQVDWREAEGGPLAEDNPYIGPKAVGEGIFARLMEEIDGLAVTPKKFVAEGSDVVALGRYTGTHARTGEPLDAQFVHHWTVEHGKVTRFQQYTDTRQWTRIYGGD